MTATKITKRQYEAEKARLSALLAQVQDVRDNFCKALNEGIGMNGWLSPMRRITCTMQ